MPLTTSSKDLVQVYERGQYGLHKGCRLSEGSDLVSGRLVHVEAAVDLDHQCAYAVVAAIPAGWNEGSRVGTVDGDVETVRRKAVGCLRCERGGRVKRISADANVGSGPVLVQGRGSLGKL
jgi:hypothetical protein